MNLLLNKNSDDLYFSFPNGKKATVLDFGVNAISSDEETALKVAEATMGGLGKVTNAKNKVHVEIPENVAIATLSCQLAGWSISLQGKNSLGSGPARILAKKPKELLKKLAMKKSQTELHSFLKQIICQNRMHVKISLKKQMPTN